MKSKIENIFISIVALFILWGGYMGLELTSGSSKPQTMLEIPSSAASVIVFHPTLSLKNSIDQLLMNPTYQSTYQLMKKNALKASKEELNLDLGLDFLKPILLVKPSKEANDFYIMATLSQPSKFKKALQKELVKGQIWKQYAVIYFTDQKPQLSELKPIKWEGTNEITLLDEQQNAISINIESDTIFFTGSSTISQRKVLSYLPNSKGLFIQVPMNFSENLSDIAIPNEFQELVQKIDQLALVYDGILLQKEGLNPLFNAVFSTRESIQEDQMEMYLKAIPNLSFSKTDDQYEIQYLTARYVLKRLSEKEWFLGLTPSQIEKNNQSIYFALKGNPSDLLKIEGSSILSLGMALIPGFVPTKEYLSKFENCMIEGIQQENKVSLQGKIVLKGKRDFLLETVDYLMRLQ